MKKLRPNLAIWKCNIQMLLGLLVMMIISLLYQIAITLLLFIIWPILFFIGSWALSNDKFEKWIDIYDTNIPKIPEDNSIN